MSRFYLAGRYSGRLDYQRLAAGIASASYYQSVASWLYTDDTDGDGNPLTDHVIAERDLADIRASDVLVLVDSDSTRGGMWTEFGYALALGKRIVVLRDDRSLTDRGLMPVFAYSDRVTRITLVAGTCLIDNGGVFGGGHLPFLQATRQAWKAWMRDEGRL